jgi:flagellar motor switch protein FliM
MNQQGPSPYDFGKSDKFSSDQNRFLQKIFSDFAEGTVQKLAPLLKSRYNMELISIKTRSYHSYLNSLPDPTPVLVFNINDNVSGFLDVDFELAFSLFERLLGGRGGPPPENQRPYFTDLEKTILKIPFLKILASYGEAWQGVQQIEPKFQSLEFNPNAVYICSPSELMVVTSFQVNLAQAQGLLSLCLPFQHLRDMIPKTSFDTWQHTSGVNIATDGAVVFPETIHNAKVPVSLSLGRAELLFQELLTIEVGDTIRLDAEITQPLRVKVNDKTKFFGQPGIKDGRMATRITKVLEEGDEEYDE